MNEQKRTPIEGRGAATLRVRSEAADLIAEVVWAQAFNKAPQAVPRARAIGHEVVRQLRREGLITGTKAVDSAEILEAVKRQANERGEAPARGVSHLVAQALVLLNLNVVHQDTISALVPDIDAGPMKNTVQMAFRRALRKFNNWKWINKSDDGLITIVDRNALTTWFTMAEDVNAERAATTLNIARAVSRINAAILAGDTGEVRRRELIAIKRVMESAPGSITNARGSVRAVPRSNPI